MQLTSKMELMSLLFSTITLAFVALIFMFPALRNKKTSHKYNLPPGSNGWPVIGETLEFLSKPEKFIHDRMKKYSPKIFRTRLFGEPMVVLCGTAGNKFVAVNEGIYMTAWRPHSMQKLFRSSDKSGTISREEELHLIKAPGFLRSETLVGYVGDMDYEVQQYLNMHWKGKQIVNAFDEMELMTVVCSSRFFLGLQDHERSLKLARLFHDIGLGLHSITINFPGTDFYRAKKSVNALKKEIFLIIKEKKAAISGGKRMNDVLTHMIVNKGHNSEFMSENEVCGKIIGNLVASFSSPASALAFVLKFIGERPEVYEKIQEEQLEVRRSKNFGEALNWHDLQRMKYTWNTSLEVMRLIPPLQGTFREAITDFTYEGFTIPKGWKIFWTVSSTNKNPDCFPNPDEFVDTRFEQEISPMPYRNIPFGGGSRVCPGKEYIRLVFLIILHNVVKNFKWEVIEPNEKIIPSMIPLPIKGLPVRLIPK